MKYQKFSYLYPPTPQTPLLPSLLNSYSTDDYLAQVKVNGDCTVIFTDGETLEIRNRHKEKFSPIKERELKKIVKDIHRGNGWIVLVGEFMTKSKKDSKGKNFNGNFILFDILVYESKQLIGQTYQQRYDFLTQLYATENYYDDFLTHSSLPHIYVVRALNGHLVQLYASATMTDMYEGLVLKPKTIRLNNCSVSRSNSLGQIKFRKATKNYQY